MIVAEFVYRSTIPAPAQAVFEWHARPGAFERLRPPWMNVRVVAEEGTIEPGDWKRLRVAFGPLGVSWTLRHERGQDTYEFVDVQERGPFRAWRHAHRVEPDGLDACWLEDRIAYQFPLHRLTAPLATRPFHRELERLFAFRHHRTTLDVMRHLGSGVPGPLRIAVTGASGLVGRHLVAFLRAGGHEVVTLVRRRPVGDTEVYWDPDTGQIEASQLERLDAVVHLAGASIAGGRWTARRKAVIRESRVRGTALLATTLTRLKRPPRVLVSSSAVGYYGDAGDQVLTEEAPVGAGFLAGVCRDWEEATAPARAAGIRVVHPRTGIVIAGDGGLLPRMALPFRLGVGGRLGDGRQYLSWISLDDLLGVLLAAIADERLAGAVNAVAPNPVTNQEFTETLARVLHRPAVARVPAFLLRAAAGQLASELILASQRVLPSKLLAAGFGFAFPTLEEALRFELGRFRPGDAGPPLFPQVSPVTTRSRA